MDAYTARAREKHKAKTTADRNTELDFQRDEFITELLGDTIVARWNGSNVIATSLNNRVCLAVSALHPLKDMRSFNIIFRLCFATEAPTAFRLFHDNGKNSRSKPKKKT